jgi:hypothetical protein
VSAGAGRPRKPKTRKVAEPEPIATRARKKTLIIDQQLLDRARHALGARTETDAVTQALQAVVQRERQIEGVRALALLGPIDPSLID